MPSTITRNIACRLARPPRQGPRHLRPGRPAAAGEHRSDQRVRLGAADRHSRQGPRADAAEPLLVRPARRAAPPALVRRRATSTCRRASTARRSRAAAMLVRKTEVVPIECVVRGYLSGSGWKEYQQTGAVCGIVLPPGLRESDQLPEPIFTPATKAEHGEHDENITFDETCQRGRHASWPKQLRQRQPRHLHARRRRTPRAAASSSPTRSSSSAMIDGELILIDEVLTPDSSRFWPADEYKPGQRPAVVRQAVRPRLAHRRAAGTRTARRRRCRPTSSPRRGRSISRRSSESTGETFAWK